VLILKGLKSIFFYKYFFYIRDLGGEEESPEKDVLILKGLKSIFFYKYFFYIRDLGGEEESPEKDADDAVTDRVNQVTSIANPDYI
jgi:hypothetical protein